MLGGSSPPPGAVSPAVMLLSPIQLAPVGQHLDNSPQLPAPPAAPVLLRAAAPETAVRRWQLKPGELLVVDEASLAGTFALDRLATQARGSGRRSCSLAISRNWGRSGRAGPSRCSSTIAKRRPSCPRPGVLSRPGSGGPVPSCGRARRVLWTLVRVVSGPSYHFYDPEGRHAQREPPLIRVRTPKRKKAGADVAVRLTKVECHFSSPFNWLAPA